LNSGDLAKRIERGIGEQVGRRLRVAEWREHHVVRHVAGFLITFYISVRPVLSIDIPAQQFLPYRQIAVKSKAIAMQGNRSDERR